MIPYPSPTEKPQGGASPLLVDRVTFALLPRVTRLPTRGLIELGRCCYRSLSLERHRLPTKPVAKHSFVRYNNLMDAQPVPDSAEPFALPESDSLAVGLLRQTRVGRRQWTTAQVLAAAPAP